MPFPAAIRDSLPWFAVFEMQHDNRPFTRNHLGALAQKNARVAMVYFATWCVPCRVGLKQIAENKDALAESRTAVVLVNVGERDKDLISSFLEGLSLSDMLTVTDPFGRLSSGFDLVKEGETMALPRTILLDSSMKPLLMLGEEGDDFIQILKGGTH